MTAKERIRVYVIAKEGNRYKVIAKRKLNPLRLTFTIRYNGIEKKLSIDTSLDTLEIKKNQFYYLITIDDKQIVFNKNTVSKLKDVELVDSIMYGKLIPHLINPLGKKAMDLTLLIYCGASAIIGGLIGFIIGSGGI